MLDKSFIEKIIVNFNIRMELANRALKEEGGTFENAIANLNLSRECIDGLQHVVNQMKQEEHDLTQDVYNKFKDKNYSHNIKF